MLTYPSVGYHLAEPQETAPVSFQYTPDDDGHHEPDPTPSWRESRYFSCYDTRAGLGLWHSIGERPQKGITGFALGVWGARTLYAAETDSMAPSERLSVAGMHYECLRPMMQWRVSFDGPMLDASGKQLRVDRDRMGSAREASGHTVPVSFDLEFMAVDPPCVYRPNTAWSQLFTGHIDQVGHWTGKVSIAGEQQMINCWGACDHSWGTRDWLAPKMWRWFDVSTADGAIQIVMWKASMEIDEPVDGAIYRGGKPSRIVAYDEKLETTPSERKPVPTNFQSTFRDEHGGTLVVAGRVTRIFPVVFASRDRSRLSWNDRAAVECEIEGRSAYGCVEFAEVVKA
jgi:hypothetical protein